MKRNTRKLCAVILVVSMLFSLLPGAAFAAPTGNSGSVTLQPYTSMEDLIQKATAELQAQGAVAEPAQADAALVSAVESKSDESFDAVKNAVKFGLLNNFEEGVVDTAAYNLSADDMKQLMKFVLQENYLTKDVNYQFDTDNGIVTGIRFDLSDSLASAMAGFQAMKQPVEWSDSLQAAAAQAVAEEQHSGFDFFGLNTLAEGDEADQQKLFEGHDTAICKANLVTTATTINFIWAEKPTEEIDYNNPILGYVGEGDSLAPEQVPKKNEIGLLALKKFHYELEGATYICPVCQHEITVDQDGVQRVEMSVYVNSKDKNAAPVQLERAKDLSEVVGDQKPNYVKFQDFDLAVLKAAVMSDNFETVLENENGPIPATNSDQKIGTREVSDLNAEEAYLHLRTLIQEKPECFGIPTEFWTDKTKNENIFGAIKIALNMEAEDPDMSGMYADYLPLLTKGFAACVYHYQDALLMAADNAQSKVEAAEEALAKAGNSADIYKLLILHDWLANNDSFDMTSLLDKSGAVGMDSLLGMTPFSMIGTAIGYRGGVCLGYTASYAYLVQNAFSDNYYNEDGTVKPAGEDGTQTPMVDFVKIRFNCDPADTSVAGGASGFTDRFNQPHFFNAVKVGDKWYYVDACYDDVNPEVISQERVETEGNISHMYFLSAPSTFEEQFEDNYDYIDSKYDGKTYIAPEDADAYQAEVISTKKAGWATETAADETRYEDDTYETAWFSNAQSEIVLHNGNWYYVEATSIYSDMGNQQGGQQGGTEEGDNSEMIKEYGPQFMKLMGDMKKDPQAADQLKSRPVADDAKAEGTKASLTAKGGMDNLGYEIKPDTTATSLFHYGYGYVDYNAEDVAGSTEDGDFGFKSPFAADAADDIAYRQIYPELGHGIGLDSTNNKLYFNLSNKILCYDLTQEDSSKKVTQIKEYNDVSAIRTGKYDKFIGMDFGLVTTPGEYQFRYRPLSGFSVHDALDATSGKDSKGEPQPITANGFMPKMYVAVATNLTNSYPADGTKYETEAVNYNPSYQRQLAGDEKDGEGVNSNVEFMWCANLVDSMNMSEVAAEIALLTDESATLKDVTVDAYCDKKGFTDKRTEKFGLSDGTKKNETDNAGKHVFGEAKDEKEGVWICQTCHKCMTDEEHEAYLNQQEQEFKPGDVNCDGVVDIFDVVIMCNYAVGEYEEPADDAEKEEFAKITANVEKYGDLNDDTVCDIFDIVLACDMAVE